MWVDFNINSYVRVKLTAEGVSMLKREHDELFGAMVHKYPFRLPEVDRDGWSKFQLWDLMHKLGRYCTLGAPNPFLTEIQFEVKPAQGEIPSNE